MRKVLFLLVILLNLQVAAYHLGCTIPSVCLYAQNYGNEGFYECEDDDGSIYYSSCLVGRRRAWQSARSVIRVIPATVPTTALMSLQARQAKISPGILGAMTTTTTMKRTAVVNLAIQATMTFHAESQREMADISPLEICDSSKGSRLHVHISCPIRCIGRH